MKKQNYFFIILILIVFSSISSAQKNDFRMGYDLYFGSGELHWNSSGFEGKVDDFDAIGISISLSTQINNNFYFRTTISTMRSRALYSYTNTELGIINLNVGTLDIDELRLDPLLEYKTNVINKFYWFINSGFSLGYILHNDEGLSDNKWRLGAPINTGIIWNVNNHIATSFDLGIRKNLFVQSESLMPTVSFDAIRLGLSIHYWLG